MDPNMYSAPPIPRGNIASFTALAQQAAQRRAAMAAVAPPPMPVSTARVQKRGPPSNAPSQASVNRSQPKYGRGGGSSWTPLSSDPPRYSSPPAPYFPPAAGVPAAIPVAGVRRRPGRPPGARNKPKLPVHIPMAPVGGAGVPSGSLYYSPDGIVRYKQ